MELMLFGLLAVLLVFMVINTRRRTKQMKKEQEEKARNTVPGAKVLLQGGLYGTIVAFDPENLDEPALVEIAPGVIIEVHSQAVLRIVEPIEDEVAAEADALEDAAAPLDDAASDSAELTNETPEETRARLDRDADDK